MPRAAPPIAAPAALPPCPANLFIGTSGWAYPSWKPGFYPKDVPPRSFLPYYASHLTSVEVNYTFRTLPTHAQVQSWVDATPPGFRFSFKAPQRLTHFSRLRDCEDALLAFLDSIEPARRAGKLGPLLFQLPPNFAADRDRLGRFLDAPALRGELAPHIAFEFRHPSWFEDPVLDLLRGADVALCVAESEEGATPDIRTASHRCYRLRRPGGYPSHELDTLAKRLTASANEGEVFAYLKHEDEPTGALNALALLRSAVALTGMVEPTFPLRRKRSATATQKSLPTAGKPGRSAA